MNTIEQLKYPIGKLSFPKIVSEKNIEAWINHIENFPSQVIKEVENLNLNELAYKYRPEGWTIHQVVTHCIDSHMNSIIRFKLALTEDSPTIRPYEEAEWAKLADANYDINEALLLLKYLHKRWVFLLKQLTPKELSLPFIHPSENEKISLKENIYIYSWHCNHHLQHIINAKKFKF